ncbi:hypothetical protein CsatB_002095 [Cannabis sativa]
MENSKPNAKLKLKRAMEMLTGLVSSSQTPFSKFHTPNHPPYSLMIFRAIMELNEGNGSSYEEIFEFIEREYCVMPFALGPFLRHYLRKLCGRREVLCVNDGVYILPDEGLESKKRKRGRKSGKKVGTQSKMKVAVEEIGKGRRIEEQGVSIKENDEQKKREDEEVQREVAVVENVDKGKEEETEIAEEQSKLERQQVNDVENEAAMQRTSLVVNNEEIVQQITKEKYEEAETLNKEGNVAGEKQNEMSEEQQPQVLVERNESENLNKECNEGETEEKHNEAVDEPLGISLKRTENDKSNEEHNESEERQYEVTEEQQTKLVDKTCQLAEAQNQQQQQQDEESKLSYDTTTTASALNDENVEHGEQKNEVIEEQQQPGMSFDRNDVQTQHTKVKKKQQLYKIRFSCKTRSASAQTAITPSNDPSSKGEQINMEQISELPIMQVFPGLKSFEKKLCLVLKRKHDQCHVQKRQLRSHNRLNIPALVPETTILEPPMLPSVSESAASSGHQNEQKPKALRKRGRPSKPKTQMKEKLPKCLGRGRPPKPKTDEGSISGVCVQNQKEQQPRRQDRGRPRKPKSDTEI